MITINLKDRLTGEQELWLLKNVGPRLHYLHNSVGGEGWIAKQKKVSFSDKNQFSFHYVWELSFEDDRIATWFILMFPND